MVQQETYFVLFSVFHEQNCILPESGNENSSLKGPQNIGFFDAEAFANNFSYIIGLRCIYWSDPCDIGKSADKLHCLEAADTCPRF